MKPIAKSAASIREKVLGEKPFWPFQMRNMSFPFLEIKNYQRL